LKKLACVGLDTSFYYMSHYFSIICILILLYSPLCLYLPKNDPRYYFILQFKSLHSKENKSENNKRRLDLQEWRC